MMQPAWLPLEHPCGVSADFLCQFDHTWDNQLMSTPNTSFTEEIWKGTETNIHIYNQWWPGAFSKWDFCLTSSPPGMTQIRPLQKVLIEGILSPVVYWYNRPHDHGHIERPCICQNFPSLIFGAAQTLEDITSIACHEADHKKQPYITQALTVLDVPYKAPCNYIHRAESPRNCMKLCLKLLNIVATFSHFIPNLSKSVINNAAKSLRKVIFPENVTSAESVCFRDKVNISEVCEGPPLNRCRTACRFLALT